MNIGLIGFGTIGRAVARAVHDGRAGNAELVALLVRDLTRVRADGLLGPACRVTANANEFFTTDMEVVVEAAGHAALKQFAERTLHSGRDLLAVSVGAFCDEEVLASVRRAAEESGRKLLIPSGALGALDAISSSAVGTLDDVTLTVRKPPAAWKGTPAEQIASSAQDKAVCIYEGRARDAARAFPQNVNVAAALSLAGIGFDRTKIKMFADPDVTHNTFELVARGDFGEVKLELKNRPYPENPKTGYLVVMSLIKSIRRLQESVIVGF